MTGNDALGDDREAIMLARTRVSSTDVEPCRQAMASLRANLRSFRSDALLPSVECEHLAQLEAAITDAIAEAALNEALVRRRELAEPLSFRHRLDSLAQYAGGDIWQQVVDELSHAEISRSRMNKISRHGYRLFSDRRKDTGVPVLGGHRPFDEAVLPLNIGLITQIGYANAATAALTSQQRIRRNALIREAVFRLETGLLLVTGLTRGRKAFVLCYTLAVGRLSMA